MSPLRHAVAASLTTLALGVTVQAGNWPQFRGPHGQGVSDEAALPSTWSPATNVAWKTAIAGLGHSSPIVWGNHVFLTTAIEGEPLPGAKAPVHMLQEDPGKPASEFVHPDSLGADRKHTYKVMALALDTGAVRWEKVAYEGPVYDGRHKRWQLRLADAGDRRHPGLRLLRLRGRLRLRLRRQAAVEGRHRRHQDARHGHGELAGALQEPRHPAVRRGQRRRRRSSPRSTPRPARRCGRRSGRRR